MAIPVISNTTSVLGYRKGQYFEYQMQATNSPTSWTANGLPSGMSISNAKAVIEALCNHQSAFVRTPKYGIAAQSRTHDWKKSSYKAMKTLTPFIELIFGFFFLFVVIDAAMRGSWSSAILLLPFPIGFFYTSTGSLARMIPNHRASRNPAGTAHANKTP